MQSVGLKLFFVSVANVEVSTDVPIEPNAFGALNYSDWRYFGDNILVVSNINNWISCVPATHNGGSLASGTSGNIECVIVNVRDGSKIFTITKCFK